MGRNAGLWSGPKTYFFADDLYIRVSRGETGPGAVDPGYPRRIVDGWNWGSFGCTGIDAALFSLGKAYFFRGNQYIRVTRGGTGPGEVDPGYPRRIDEVWNWPFNWRLGRPETHTWWTIHIDAALFSVSKTYVFTTHQYVRVTRKETGPGTVDAGYPKSITAWGWPRPFTEAWMRPGPADDRFPLDDLVHPEECP